MIEHDPWADAHAPQKFERTDRSGRWSPIHEEDEIPDPIWVALLGGAMLALLIAAGFVFALGWEWI